MSISNTNTNTNINTTQDDNYWIQYETDDKEYYYFNTKTHKTQWERPLTSSEKSKGGWYKTCSNECNQSFFNISTNLSQDAQPDGEELPEFISAEPYYKGLMRDSNKLTTSAIETQKSIKSETTDKPSAKTVISGTNFTGLKRVESKLTNTNATMCYLDAAFQLLLHVPEIVTYFEGLDDKKILDLQLKQETQSDSSVGPNPECVNDEGSNKIIITNLNTIFKEIFKNTTTNTKTSIKDIPSEISPPSSAYFNIVSGKESIRNNFLEANGSSYKQSDSIEFLLNCFLNPLKCFKDIPIINELTINESETVTCSTGKTYVSKNLGTQLIQLKIMNKNNKSINDLIQAYTMPEEMDTPIDGCGTQDESKLTDAEKSQFEEIKNKIAEYKNERSGLAGNSLEFFNSLSQANKNFETAQLKEYKDPNNNDYKKELADAYNILLGKQTNDEELNSALINRISSTVEFMNLIKFKLDNNLTAFGTQGKQLEIPNDTKYILFSISRKNDANSHQTDHILIDKNLTIDSKTFTIKGCIFHHIGGKDSGHYVYGAYENGNPAYVIDDLNNANADDVFNQKSWGVYVCLYELTPSKFGGGKLSNKKTKKIRRVKKPRYTKRQKKPKSNGAKITRKK